LRRFFNFEMMNFYRKTIICGIISFILLICKTKTKLNILALKVILIPKSESMIILGSQSIGIYKKIEILSNFNKN